MFNSGDRIRNVLPVGRDLDEVEAMVKETVATFGRLDVAFNNAGIQNALAETADATPEDFDRVNSVNLRGAKASGVCE